MRTIILPKNERGIIFFIPGRIVTGTVPFFSLFTPFLAKRVLPRVPRSYVVDINRVHVFLVGSPGSGSRGLQHRTSCGPTKSVWPQH